MGTSEIAGVKLSTAVFVMLLILFIFLAVIGMLGLSVLADGSYDKSQNRDNSNAPTFENDPTEISVHKSVSVEGLHRRRGSPQRAASDSDRLGYAKSHLRKVLSRHYTSSGSSQDDFTAPHMHAN